MQHCEQQATYFAMTEHQSQVGRMQRKRVVVIGAGVIGLSTALCIQNNIPGTSVTVIADRFIQDTLSFGAAGFFRPDENIGPTLDITRYGIFYNSILADPRKYLKWLTHKILCNGGDIKNQVVKDLQDLKDFNVVVNCSGLRAKELTEDPLLTPVRGQVIKVLAPWVTQFYYANGCYILPGTEYVTLGGTKQLGDWNMEVSQHDRDYIWNTCTAVLPSLKDAKVIEDWVGLRPFRQPIRIEAEVLGSGSNQCKVVHNYGHGAHGINTSWGTALHATHLVSDMLQHETVSILAKL
ncbi:D-aspartate oxidase-like isoform X4 [Dermacentor variabilis]|uniref:D-aspartate oxidase-like isoform X4 n=1 Tax=Dermacentor variabilis TaxID=34621 RepID=UPI003F5B152B